MKILVTGAAGFVGSYVAAALVLRGDTVTGIDNLNSYYDPNLRQPKFQLYKTGY
jgi:UDP-glucuronate 4-epimerase